MVGASGTSGKTQLSAFAIAMLLVGLIFWGLHTWSTSAVAPERFTSPKFRSGEMVRMVAFDNHGMIVTTRCPLKPRQCTYDVRFSAIQSRTNVSLFGKDGAIDVAPIALVRGIREFELALSPTP